MTLRIAASAAALAIMLASFGIVSADTLSVSCSGTAATSSITWTATSTGGVAPIAFVWGNGSTSTAQTVNYGVGTHSMSIQATDASSTVANNTCLATIAPLPGAPTINSFTATPSAIAVGQSSLLAWNVSSASSTSLNNGIGAVSSTSLTVSPTITTTYQLTAVNPQGTSTASVAVQVGTSTPGTGGNIQERIAALFQQIKALQAQLAQMIAAKFGVTVENPGFIPPGKIGKAACIILHRDLGFGSEGDDVKSIQEMLSQDPDVGFNATPTGVFGPITEKAMKKFQEKHGIISKGTGNVGPLTRGFFSRHCGQGFIKHAPSATVGTTSTTTSQIDDDDDDDDDGDDGDDNHGNSGNSNGNGQGHNDDNGNGNSGNSGNGNGNGNGKDDEDDDR